MSSKWSLIEQAARNLGDFRFDGIVSAATVSATYALLTIPNTTLASSLSLLDGFAFIPAANATAASYHYRIAAFDPSTKQLSLLPTTYPATGATIYCFKDFAKRDYDIIFDSVFKRLAGRILVVEEASSAVSTLATTIDYAVPTTWKYIHAVELHEDGETWPVLPNFGSWNVRGASIRFAYDISSYATMYLFGQKHPAAPSTDSETIETYNQLFDECLVHRMDHQLGLRKLKSVIQTGVTSGKSVATSYGTLSIVATTSQVATRSGVATTVGTLAVLDHVTGREERSTDQELQASNELSSGLNQSSEVTDAYTDTGQEQVSTMTEDDWLNFVVTAKDAADSLEMYLFERPKTNARRLR